ncbi:MAG: tRNA-i(6)A37 thiotransferase enzyme MiaB [Clostridiales bacterium]|nr:tRNA-i(6)A37 thiotransferase enzyme MiaB [Clostridiales bacterium]
MSERAQTTVLNATEAQIQSRIIEELKAEFDKEFAQTGKQKKMCITTFGCQMNAHDSEKLEGILEQIGYEKTDDENEADFVLYNTCTVRENANLKVYGRLGHLNKLKQNKPSLVIALCGCMMQEDTVIAKIKKSYRFVDIIFGTHNIYKLAELIKTRRESGRMVIDIWKEQKEIVEDLPSDRKYKFKACVNIMYGCNNFCSYCIVPYVRGRERSRKPEDIINEIKRLVEDGVVEITLLGQNVNSYGKNLQDSMSFANLLQEVEKVEGLERIRFMTSHPKDLSDDLIEVFKNSKKICSHIHLPFQSGSTRILNLMNRKYTKDDYLELVRKIKAARPDVTLTTDIIVGFPGETDEDFEHTLDVVKQVKYNSAYTFIYSKRTGTPAALMDDQVSDEIIKVRFNKLHDTIQEIGSNITDKEVGGTYKVLIEEVNEKDNSLVSGRLENNLVVHLKGTKDLIGKIINVKIVEAKGFYFFGELA